MSLRYKIMEKACFILNALPGGGVKRSMSGMMSGDSTKIRLPGFMKRGLRTDLTDHGGVMVHRIRSLKASEKPSRAILFLPGGGGMARATRLHYDTARRLALRTGAEIFIVHYPLAPEHNVRYALDRLELFYLTVLAEYRPEDIILMGDSAGANLILSLTHRLSVKPGGLVVISPACGLENGRNRDIRKEMEKYDPLLTVAMNDTIAENWCRGVPLSSPDISPEYIELRDLPPVLMFYGSHELFYPHLKNFIMMMQRCGVDLQPVEKPMCHDWALCSFLPEGREAVRTIDRWIGDLRER